MTKYKYATELVPQKMRSQKNTDAIQQTLDKYAAEGWRLHSVQAMDMIGYTLLIFETIDDNKDTELF